MRKFLLFILLLILTGGSVFSGDIATFINLGFSQDSKYFMFGQYGIKEKTSTPYSNIYIVNIDENTFVANGQKKAEYPGVAQPGQEDIGALLTLLASCYSLSKDYAIDHLKTGRLLYVLLNGEKPLPLISFRDFINDTRYTITLVQSEYKTGDQVSASFYIDLTISASSGDAKHFIVGRPDYRRTGILSYKIRRIFLSPDEKSLVFLIEKDEKSDTGINVRYMIETVTIKK